MAILSNKYNLLFIMNPRTGCTATGKMMIEEMEGEYIPSEDILGEDGKVLVQQKHTTVRELVDHQLLDEGKIDSLHKFSVVRNPFDSLVSLWTKKRYKYVGAKANDPNSIVNRLPGYKDDMEFIQNHTFSEWIEELFPRRKSPSVNLKHMQGVDQILRFENLQSDFSDMLNSLSIPREFEIPLYNQTKNRTSDYREYYTPKARAVIETKFKEELDMLGYSF